MWIYLLAFTAGIVFLVPTLVRAIDNMATDLVHGVIGVGATVFGAIGLLLDYLDVRWVTVVVAAVALGLAAGAIYPEAIAKLGTADAGTAGAAPAQTPVAANSTPAPIPTETKAELTHDEA